MKKVILLALYVLIISKAGFAQCSASFMSAVNSETVTFTNQSSVPNAHYFWNFGDGTGSNSQNPVHTFPESGRYIVTLYAKDTVSNCSTFYESRFNLTKLSNDVCQPDSILDSISYNGGTQGLYLDLIEKSVNCSSYGKSCEAGVNSNMPSPAYLGIFNNPAQYVGRVNYSTFDNNINQYVNRRSVYKTVRYRFNNAKNYNNCSANFEFKTISQDANGERILFTAMNRTATAYKWNNFSSTNTVSPVTDTMSFYFPFNLYSNKLVMVLLATTGSTGCKDTTSQIIRIKYQQYITGLKEYELNSLTFDSYPNPAQDKLVVSTPDEVSKITMFDCLGKELLVLQKPQSIQEIDIAALPPGVYFLKVENNKRFGISKVVKSYQ